VEDSTLEQLLPGLIEATENGKISWSAGEDDMPLEFTAEAGAVKLFLGCVDRDNQRPYYLAVGRAGQPVETMEGIEQNWNGDNFVPVELDVLWNSVRRSAFGVDVVLKDLTDFLASSGYDVVREGPGPGEATRLP
jgi:hypothetical protein